VTSSVVAWSQLVTAYIEDDWTVVYIQIQGIQFNWLLKRNANCAGDVFREDSAGNGDLGALR